MFDVWGKSSMFSGFFRWVNQQVFFVSKICNVLWQHGFSRETYLCQMSCDDAIRVTGLHKQQHGVDGLIGSLDCMHVGW
jgi:hypothetical protein